MFFDAETVVACRFSHPSSTSASSFVVGSIHDDKRARFRFVQFVIAFPGFNESVHIFLRLPAALLVDDV